MKNDAQAANEKAGNDINKPSDKLVADTTKPLTEEAKKAIAKKIKAVNPDTKAIFVDDEGNATVTLEDGTTATILAKDLVRTEEQAKGPNAGNNVNTPADKVVADPDKLTEENKNQIAENIKSVNPEAKVAFDKYGNATVTTKDGAIATIPVKNLVKTQDEATKPTAGNNVNKPADKVVADPADFNDNDKKAAIKKAIEDNIKAVNPGALVVVDDLGNATVTLPNGKTAVIPAKDLTKPSAEVAKPKAGNDIVKPADKTVVANPDALTDAEKNAIGAKVSEVNPDAKYIAVDDKGNVTVTLNDGKVAVIPAKDLTKTAEEAAKPKAGNDVVKPADRTKVANPELLTNDEKDAIKKKVEAVNPDATVVVDDQGNATVTPKDGEPAVIPAKDLTKNTDAENSPKAGNDIVKPASKIKVANPNDLTLEEKKAIEDKVRAVNPEAKTIVIDEKGNATVTLPDGSTAVIPATDLTKSQDDIIAGTAKDNANIPAAKTKVADPNKLTDDEKKVIEDKVKALNPESKVIVDENGNITVVTKDGNASVIPVSDLVKTNDDVTKENAGNDANTPAAKTVVGDPTALNDTEKKAIEDKVKAVNPEGTTVVVDGKGNATLTKPDGTMFSIPASDLVIQADKLADQAKNAKVKTPALRTLVGDKGNLKDSEKEAVKKSIEAVNPGAIVVVDAAGNATVTLEDGSTATIPKDQLVKDKEDAKAKNGGNNLELDLRKIQVMDLEKINKGDRDRFEFMMLGAITNVEEFNLDAYLKTVDENGNTVYTSKKSDVKITIDKDGNAVIEKNGKKELAVRIDEKGNVTIVTKEGQVLAIPRDDAFKEILSSGSSALDDLESPEVKLPDPNENQETNINLPEKVKVNDKANLTDKEKSAIKEALIKANPKLKDAKITISSRGEATIVYPNGRVIVIPAEKLVIGREGRRVSNKILQKDSKHLAKTGTSETSTGLVGLATIIFGGLLSSRRRKNDEN